MKNKFVSFNNILRKMIEALRSDNMEEFEKLDKKRADMLEEIKNLEFDGISDGEREEIAKEVEESLKLTKILMELGEEKKEKVKAELVRIKEARDVLLAYKPRLPEIPKFLDIKE